MLHIENIKFTRNNGPELPAPQPHVSNENQDLFSSAGFFSILKNQLQADRQFAADPFAVRQEAPKNDNPISMNATERKLHESIPNERRMEENAAAAGRVDEQGQKAGLRNQAKETGNADAQKNVTEKRTDNEHQVKKAAGKETESGRIKHERKEKKQGAPDMREMIDGLNRMIDIFKGKDQPEIRNAKLAAQELQDRLRDMKTQGDRMPLKKVLEKLSAAIRALEANGMKGSPAEHFAGVLAGMKSQRSKIKENRDAAQQRKTATAPDSPINAAKELLARIEAALDTVRNDGPGQRSARDGQGSSDIFSFNQFKSETTAKHADVPAAQRHNSLFRENLESIIQNAKVVVKDGRNGSFSVRLHPRELGSVNISLNLHDGVVHGKFLVDTQEAKDLLTQQPRSHQAATERCGHPVGEFQVNVNDRRGEDAARPRGETRIVVIAPAERQWR